MRKTFKRAVLALQLLVLPLAILIIAAAGSNTDRKSVV